MSRKDFWLILIIIVTIASCIKLDNPQMIDCTKPVPVPTPIIIHEALLKDHAIDSCEIEVDSLKEELKAIRELYLSHYCGDIDYD